MRVWKILGLATLAGVVAAGVAVERRRRTYRSYDTDELRATLHARLAAAGPPSDTAEQLSDRPADGAGA